MRTTRVAFYNRIMTLVGAFVLLALAITPVELESARDRQDRPALERMAGVLAAQAEKRNDAVSRYSAALAHSYLATVAMERQEKDDARRFAEAGIPHARRAVDLNPREPEYHRLLGTLCGQVIPANVLAGLRWGKCAQEEISRAIELNPRFALAHVGRGVGNYYLPSALGGGVELAIRDFRKAIQLDARLAEAHLWLGIALRKANRNAEARKALEKALQLNPRRVWARQQLDKTPIS